MGGESKGDRADELYPKSEIEDPKGEVLAQLKRAEAELSERKPTGGEDLGILGSLSIRNKNREEALEEVRTKIKELEEK